VETVFAVAIRPLSISVADLALFGVERLGEDFPTRTEQPPISTPIEVFDGPTPNIVPSLSLLTGAPPIRLWFQTEDKTRLVQLQRDYLACNWQGLTEDVPYPRYPTTEEFFLKTLDMLSDFAIRRDGDVAVNQCELTYVNHITAGGVWERHGQIDRVIRLASRAGEFLSEPEDAQLVFRYRIPFAGKDIGRLYVQATPGVKSDGSLVIQLNMVARGHPTVDGRDGVVGFFRLAHEWIVRGFAAVTTDTAQRELWRRIP
jgi:uncharacterized protein (TIGR04255 family)